MRVSKILFYAFFVSMYLPTTISFAIGSLRLTPYRFILLFFFAVNLPKIFSYLKYSKDKNNAPFYFILSGVWSVIALVINHGAEGFESGGIYLIEQCAPFFIVIAYCKGIKQLAELVNVMMLSIVFLLTISLPESITGFNWFRTFTDAVFGGSHFHIEPRFGLDRALATFDHPILNGVVSSSVIGFYYFCRSPAYSMIPIIATATSLSSGAIASIMAQGYLCVWEKFVKRKRRWMLLGVLSAAIYQIADLTSNRSGMMAILSVITFSAHTAYNRYYIWIFGTENVKNNPFFGLGFHDWERPSYMSSSMDNFWLVIMVRYGLPALLLYGGAIYLIFSRLLKIKPKDKLSRNIKRGWLCGLFGLVISGCTVHYWNAAFIYFNFYLGIGFVTYTILAKQARALAASEVKSHG